MHGRIGAPEVTTGADLNLLRECLEGSHATKAAGVFTPTVAPVMISPTEPKQLHSGDRGAFQNPGHPFCHRDHSVLDSANLDEHIKKKDLSELSGLRVYEMGPKIQQWLLGVIPLRSKSTGRKTATTLFPLPTSGEVLLGCFPSLDPLGVSWLSCICLGLNSMWGDNTAFEGAVTPLVKECLGELVKDVERIGALSGCLEHFDWEVFFSTRSIDYKGDEVKTARDFTWCNISPALPKEIGKVPLVDVCTQGAKHYVENIDQFIKPREKWNLAERAPRVMVPPPRMGGGLPRACFIWFMHTFGG